MNRACKDCEFSWVDHEPWVQCRREPPRKMSIDEDDGWPVVSGNDWCGEFVPRGLEHNTYDTIKKLTRCFAELDMAAASLGTDTGFGMRAQQVLNSVGKIIDLPAAVDELKKEQER